MAHDDRLAELFRAAASDAGAPPPGFDHTDVVTASRRVTARRRTALTGGAVLLAVLGIGTAVALPDGPRDDAGSVAAAPMPTQEGARDRAAEPGAGAGEMPDALREVPPVTGPPLGPGRTECADRQDPALRALMEQVLPEVAGAPEAAVTMECRPGGERGVNLEVAENGVAGLLTVVYLPPGEPVPPSADGAATATAVTASGGTVTVGVRPVGPGADLPFAGRLDTAAAFLAPRL